MLFLAHFPLYVHLLCMIIGIGMLMYVWSEYIIMLIVVLLWSGERNVPYNERGSFLQGVFVLFGFSFGF